MDVIDQAVSLNWDGARLCAEGEIKGALRAFNQALRNLSAAAHPDNESIILRRTCDPSQNVGLTFIPIDVVPTNQSSSSNKDDDNDKTRPHKHLPDALYKKALMFDLTNVVITPNCLAFATAVIEYNMALTLQLTMVEKGLSKVRII